MFGCGGSSEGTENIGGEVVDAGINEIKKEGGGEIPFLDAVFDYFEIKKVDINETLVDSPPVDCVDSDLDGYGVGLDCPVKDCDDTRPDIHPGAEEVCDGVDNDCDGSKNCLPQAPETCAGEYGACSCFVDPQVLASEGAINFDPVEIVKFHDGDTFSDSTTVYRLSANDCAETEGSDGNKCWPDQFGLGEYAEGGMLETNFGQLGKEYVAAAFQKAQTAQKVLGKLDDFGRRLGYFVVDGQLLQCLLVREGLAWETVSYYGLGSHPPLAQIVLDASKIYGEPHFQQPYKYKNQAPQCQN
jgi:endonuclease YncB( thermonuclease family)